MSAPNLHNGEPILYGLLSTSGVDEDANLHYDISDKDGIQKVTAVLSRKIHCLPIYAAAIKQSASFPGQIIEINGISYGAGWSVSSLMIVPDDQASVVSIEYRRDGVTPFEWELPPGLLCVCKNGVAALKYRKPDGSLIDLTQWDSGTGEDRYGFRVEYNPDFIIKYGNLISIWGSDEINGCRVYYENRQIFNIKGLDALAGLSSFEEYNETKEGWNTNGSGWETPVEAIAAGELAANDWIVELKANIASALSIYNTNPFHIVSGIRALVSETVSVESYQNPASRMETTRWNYRLSVRAVRLVPNISGFLEDVKRGLHWESVVDTDSKSLTFNHIFYRMRYGGAILFSIDITSIP